MRDGYYVEQARRHTPRIEVPMLQAAHAITICSWVDLKGGGGRVDYVHQPAPRTTQP